MLRLEALEGGYAVCRLPPDGTLPDWATPDRPTGVVSVTRSDQELSLIVPEAVVPERTTDVAIESGWVGFRLVGPFDFDQVGILVQLLVPLRDAGVPMLAMSTFDTDYVFVKREHREAALECLAGAGIALL